jgi:NitT/TauT family transport system substrate-binding protein
MDARSGHAEIFHLGKSPGEKGMKANVTETFVQRIKDHVLKVSAPVPAASQNHRHKECSDPIMVSRFLQSTRVCVLALVGALAGCHPKTPSGSETLPHLTLFTDWYPQAEHGGYYTAARLGYWKEEGIEVEVVPGGPKADTERRVSVEPNGLGIALADSVLLSRARGLPIVAVMTHFQRDPASIMVHENSPVHGPADLEGRAVAAANAATYFQYLIKRYQLKTTTFLPLTGSVAAFVHDPNYITQCYPTSEPFFARKLGAQPRTFFVGDDEYRPFRAIIANESLVKNHPEALRRFARGAYRGWSEFLRNPEPTFAQLQTLNPNADPEQMRFALGEIKRLHLIDGDASRGESTGKVDLTRWKELHSVLVKYGIMETSTTAEGAATDAFTPEAVGLSAGNR